MEIRTTCAHSGSPMRIVVDSELKYRVEEGPPELLVFEPRVDWVKFSEPNIIDAY